MNHEELSQFATKADIENVHERIDELQKHLASLLKTPESFLEDDYNEQWEKDKISHNTDNSLVDLSIKLWTKIYDLRALKELYIIWDIAYDKNKDVIVRRLIKCLESKHCSIKCLDLRWNRLWDNLIEEMLTSLQNVSILQLYKYEQMLFEMHEHYQ